MKKFLSAVLAMSLMLSLAACSGGENSSTADNSGSSEEAKYSIAMVTDVGGVNDQSFNQSAWEGISAMMDAGIVNAQYLESTDEADYTPNLDKFSDDDDIKLIWGIGYMMSDAIADAARKNPDKMYAIVDSSYENGEPNTIGVLFKAQEPSFLVGYIAGQMTETNKVGFVGGQKSATIDQFEYGFRAGVDYAAKELGKEITVDVQYANSFSDAAMGKGIATKMYDSCDIVFHAAGNVGNGVIEAAKEKDKWVIGVDRDQNDLAPDNVLTSAVKRVGDAIQIVTEKVMNGEELGGTTQVFSTADGCVGIAPTSDKNVPAEILEKTTALEQKIISGEIEVPYDEASFEAYLAK
ncbi:MAG: BMP family ABC transporter substrate-binding protein [Clostridiales bacterium]|nr:BMP family ABC transporter substrate-binding protein [Clostridiales bacterium]